MASADAVTISLVSTTPINTLGPLFASFNADPSCNRGFHVTNFSNPNLIAAASGLYPSRLRFGGSGADALVYGLTPGSPECAAIDPAQCAAHPDYVTPGCLNASHWERLNHLVTASRSELVFGVSFDLAAACAAGPSYKWDPSNAQTLLAYVRAHNQTLHWVELGNEINNQGGAPCSLSPASQAAALNTLAGMLQGMPTQLVGPDTGYRYPQTWLTAYLPLAAPHLRAVTHHVYNGLSRSNYNNPAQLDSPLPEIQWYTSTIAHLLPGAEVWAGENGPIGGGNDGTCGSMSVCGTFASAGWFADDMALRAKHGFHHYQRQDLFGGAYGLTTALNNEMALDGTAGVTLRPDYWINFLWKRTLGRSVLNATSSSASVRAYAFAGTPTSPYAPKACAHSAVQLLAINLSNATAASLALPAVQGSAPSYASWALTPLAGDAFTAQALLNGAPLPLTVDVAQADPSAFLQGIVQPAVTGSTAAAFVLAPLGTAFICY